MAALTAPRSTPARAPHVREPRVKAGAKIFAGALAAIDANGLGVPAGAVASLRVIGRADDTFDNTAGADGDIRARISAGCFRFDNAAAGDLIGLKDIGQPCYAVDDHTVALTSASAARPVAGTIFDVDELGVWVKIS